MTDRCRTCYRALKAIYHTDHACSPCMLGTCHTQECVRPRIADKIHVWQDQQTLWGGSAEKKKKPTLDELINMLEPLPEVVLLYDDDKAFKDAFNINSLFP